MGAGDNSDDLDADSVLRALATAPPVKPPSRTLTAMVIQLGDAANADDQIASIRELVETQESKLERRADGILCIQWVDAIRAAGVALEIRDVLPETRIAIATATFEASDKKAAVRVVDSALAILAAGAERVGIDEATALAVEARFEVEASQNGFVLVESMASGTPALVNKVIGNYKVVRLLGTGGMGVVYLAEHVSLGRKAVIKFVQDRLTKDAGYTQRFFTEAKTAASIRHPGIVDVFDYGKDDRGRGYIVMELLEGESLRTRLRREKPLKIDFAVALATQIANAVAAAHAVGVIHRDLKPDNLFLVPDNESAYKIRAKVLDFGLAKVAADPSPGVTQSGNFVGTPLYMSPEQCRAKADIDHRTDIYSLGCILYEMVTGRPPFLDKTVGDLIIAHNTLPPTPPSELAPAVSPALERAILKALAKHPEERFTTIEAFATTLAALQTSTPVVPTGTETPLARPRGVSAPPPLTDGAQRASAVSAVQPEKPAARRKQPIAIAVLGVLAIAGGAWALFHDRGTRARTVRPSATGKTTIAVLDLTSNAAGSEAWVGTAVGEVVRGDLKAVKELHVMSADEVARMRAELGIADEVELSPETLAKMRSDLGADYVVTGTFSDESGNVMIAARLYDTSSGTSGVRIEERGQESDLATLGGRVAGALQRELGIVADGEAPVQITVLPRKASAARLYSEGLNKLRRLELVEAKELFTKAAGEEPADPLVHSALANVWRELGYHSKARAEAKLAYDFSSSLPGENRRAIEAQYREANAQWDEAIKKYTDLVDLYPTRLEYGLALASVQTHSGDAKSAYKTLADLRKLPHPLGSDPRIELAEAQAAEEADDIERMRVHAERAALMAAKRGAKVLRAKALLKQGWALFTLGRDSQAEPVYAEAKQLFTEVGDRSGIARTLNNIALADHRKHRDTEATKGFAEALKIAEEIGDSEAQAWVLNNWGYILSDAGQLDKALELDMKKLELGGERGDLPSSQAAAHINISEILRWRGDLKRAHDHCNAADDLLRGLDARRFAAYTAQYCGEILRVEDDLVGAKKRFAQAIGWASDVMTPAESADMRIAMARAELDDKRPAEAEALARAASGDLAAANEGSQRVCAIAVLSSALLARGQAADAAKEILATAQLPAEGVSFACRIEADIARARVEVAQDPTRKADVLAKLEETRARAAAATFVQWELGARLAIGELSGDRAALKKLAKDADAIGFKLVARRAKAR